MLVFPLVSLQNHNTCISQISSKSLQPKNRSTEIPRMDLRAEPVLLTVPKMEEDRYFSFQLLPGVDFLCNFSCNPD